MQVIKFVSICHDATAFVYLFIYLKMKLIATRVFGRFPCKKYLIKVNCNISLKTLSKMYSVIKNLFHH